MVEDLLDIKIFSTMNLLLKQRLKDLVTELQEVEYNHKLCSEKITMQSTHIENIKNNAVNIRRLSTEISHFLDAHNFEYCPKI